MGEGLGGRENILCVYLSENKPNKYKLIALIPLHIYNIKMKYQKYPYFWREKHRFFFNDDNIQINQQLSKKTSSLEHWVKEMVEKLK